MDTILFGNFCGWISFMLQQQQQYQGRLHILTLQVQSQISLNRREDKMLRRIVSGAYAEHTISKSS